jgi:hypothetical protein
MDLYRFTNDLNFKMQKNGNVLSAAFKFITRNYKHTNLFKPDFNSFTLIISDIGTYLLL